MARRAQAYGRGNAAVGQRSGVHDLASRAREAGKRTLLRAGQAYSQGARAATEHVSARFHSGLDVPASRHSRLRVDNYCQHRIPRGRS